MYHDVDFLPELEREEVEELERLKTLYVKFMQDANSEIARKTDVAIYREETRSISIDGEQDDKKRQWEIDELKSTQDSCNQSDVNGFLAGPPVVTDVIQLGKKSMSPWKDYSFGVQARVTEGP